MSKTFGNGRYQVLDKLGSGGMAVVYKAQDTVLNRIVTVKVLRDQFASDEDFTRRFRREAQAVASLSHPNIVSVYDVGKDQDQEYIVMEFVNGQNLKEYIKEHAPLAADQAVEIAKQICDALDHAHKHQIIHRDIKPHNILLTSDGRAKVTDFGIARAVSAATVTHTGTIVGSVHYFSPEQARGEVTNEQSDLYSLGIILYEMVTGVLPYDGESPISIALKHMTDDPTPPSGVNPGVPANLQQVILRAISKQPGDRYLDAKQFKQDLQRVAQGMSALPFNPVRPAADNEMTQVIRPVKDQALPNAKKPRKRLKPIGWVAIVVLVLALAGSAYAYASSLMRVKEVKMPDITNATIDQAAKMLQLSNLRLNAENVKREYSDKVPEGLIIRQDPAAETIIKVSRSDITVFVSQGPDKASMPDVSGGRIDKETALNLIRQAGFTKEPGINLTKSDLIPENVVISQYPGPNMSWPKNGDITLEVSKGRDQIPIKMPNVVGMKQDDAVQQLDKNYHLTVNTEPKQSTEYPQGYVIESSPKADTDILQGSEVKLIISAGPGPVAKYIRAADVTELLANLTIPNDGKPHEVVFKLKDYRGWTEFDRFAYQPLAPYTRDIQFYAPATLQVLVDGQIAFTNDYK